MWRSGAPSSSYFNTPTSECGHFCGVASNARERRARVLWFVWDVVVDILRLVSVGWLEDVRVCVCEGMDVWVMLLLEDEWTCVFLGVCGLSLFVEHVEMLVVCML